MDGGKLSDGGTPSSDAEYAIKNAPYGNASEMEKEILMNLLFCAGIIRCPIQCVSALR